MRPGATLTVPILAAVVGLVGGCGGGSSSSSPRGYFGHFPEPDDIDLPRDAVFALAAPEHAVTRVRLYRWRDRDDDLRAYGNELSRISGRKYYDRVTGEHVFVPDDYLRPFARYLLVARYRDGVERIWALETGDWYAGRSKDEATGRWRAPSEYTGSADASTGKSWRTP